MRTVPRRNLPQLQDRRPFPAAGQRQKRDRLRLRILPRTVQHPLRFRRRNLPPYTFTSGRPQVTGLGAREPVQSARAIETVCYNCHMDVRGMFNLPNHHPVPEGRMTCIQCHPPHSGTAFAGGGTQLMSQNENCLQCHPSQQGPFVFEHDARSRRLHHLSFPARQHQPQDARRAECQPVPQMPFPAAQTGGVILIGGVDHTTKLSQGACWSAGCHEAVHGSRVSPTLRF